MSSNPLILGIETSCDETAVGIVSGRKLLANIIYSSIPEDGSDDQRGVEER